VPAVQYSNSLKLVLHIAVKRAIKIFNHA